MAEHQQEPLGLEEQQFGTGASKPVDIQTSLHIIVDSLSFVLVVVDTNLMTVASNIA